MNNKDYYDAAVLGKKAGSKKALNSTQQQLLDDKILRAFIRNAANLENQFIWLANERLGKIDKLLDELVEIKAELERLKSGIYYALDGKTEST